MNHLTLLAGGLSDALGNLLHNLLGLRPCQGVMLKEDVPAGILVRKCDTTAAHEIGEPDPDVVRILDQRLQEYRDNPDGASPWSAVKARILGSRAS